MATPKQLAANRANARKSTGPRSSAGKEITRLNAIKSDLTGQLAVVSADQHEAYTAFQQSFMESLRPVGVEENHVATRIARDTWRLDRAAANEANIYALGLSEIDPAELSADPASAAAFSDARVYFEKYRAFDRTSLYESRLKRDLHKDYELLRTLQKERLRQPAPTKQTTSPVIGSVLSNSSTHSFGLSFGPQLPGFTDNIMSPPPKSADSSLTEPLWPC